MLAIAVQRITIIVQEFISGNVFFHKQRRCAAKFIGKAFGEVGRTIEPAFVGDFGNIGSFLF